MSEQNSDFKVTDRRSSAGAQDEKAATSAPQRGEGFVMKEGNDEAAMPQQIDFSTFILSLATGAFIHLGLAPDMTTGKTAINLEMAKQDIELLTLLKDKTKGNLTEDENKLYESLLTEVRLRYVDASKGKA